MFIRAFPVRRHHIFVNAGMDRQMMLNSKNNVVRWSDWNHPVILFVSSDDVVNVHYYFMEVIIIMSVGTYMIRSHETECAPLGILINIRFSPSTEVSLDIFFNFYSVKYKVARKHVL